MLQRSRVQFEQQRTDTAKTRRATRKACTFTDLSIQPPTYVTPVDTSARLGSDSTAIVNVIVETPSIQHSQIVLHHDRDSLLRSSLLFTANHKNEVENGCFTNQTASIFFVIQMHSETSNIRQDRPFNIHPSSIVYIYSPKLHFSKV